MDCYVVVSKGAQTPRTFYYWEEPVAKSSHPLPRAPIGCRRTLSAVRCSDYLSAEECSLCLYRGHDAETCPIKISAPNLATRRKPFRDDTSAWTCRRPSREGLPDTERPRSAGPPSA